MNLPDTLADWPWPRQFNPYTEEATIESNIWFKSLGIYSPESQKVWNKCHYGLLCGLAYPDVSKGGVTFRGHRAFDCVDLPTSSSLDDVRAGIDLMQALFTLDEFTDVAPAPMVREIATVVMDALCNPDTPRPAGEIILGEMMSQFAACVFHTATPEANKHFLTSMEVLMNSFVAEAEDRDNHTIRSIESYFELRRGTIGMGPSYFIGELHLSIPDEALYHPVVRELEYLAADMIALDNDIASYNREQGTGNDQHNIITVVIHHLGLNLDSAVEWAADYHKDAQRRFSDTMKLVPSFGPAVDRDLDTYIQRIAMWVRGNYCWLFEGGRYFGSRGAEYQKTRRVPLLPKRKRNSGEPTVTVEVASIDELGWAAVGLDG
ncbi:terpenoid synthase [Dichomitus squalens LYAD-421 SS1]|uniref:Terpene synthase n=1 Tax=Dichomitus squalens (strain LYAD-421) TaxID=732165 RepID=R7T299_DICSQ|nr:terpenoid synthase [Dichomitus squalens LYAD-421 SS1]EJF62150.1 terpenoid synthase [Dichomitus squalens LYAD-421 SS1]